MDLDSGYDYPTSMDDFQSNQLTPKVRPIPKSPCQICGKMVNIGKRYSHKARKFVCNECWMEAEGEFICPHCECLRPIDEAHTLGDYLVCKDCHFILTERPHLIQTIF